MKTIAISNIKGGVTKTTTGATLAAGLNAKGYKVLMIDADPQMNLTMCFMSEPEEGTPSLYHFFKGEKTFTEIKKEIKPNLDLIIGDFELFEADLEFYKKTGSVKLVKNELRKLASDYDYCIIDTPTTAGFLTLNAYYACDCIITPMTADSFSLRATRLLRRKITEVENDEERKITVLGILLAKYSDRTTAAKLLEDNCNATAEILGTTLFNTRVRQATVVIESQIAKMDLFDYSPKSPVTLEYQQFVDEVIERMEVLHNGK